MTGRTGLAVAAILFGFLTGCGLAGGGVTDRVDVPRQAPVTTSTSSTVPAAPTTCTGGPRDPAACSESDGRRLPTSR
jgi:hypothetical protein